MIRNTLRNTFDFLALSALLFVQTAQKFSPGLCRVLTRSSSTLLKLFYHVINIRRCSIHNVIDGDIRLQLETDGASISSLPTFSDLHHYSQPFDADVFLSESSEYRKQPAETTYSPAWVRFLLTAEKRNTYSHSREQTENLRRIRKYNLDYQVAFDKRTLNWFYDHAYAPTLQKRFPENNRAIHSRWFFHLFRYLGGRVIIVRRYEIPIGGCFVIRVGNFATSLGWGATQGTEPKLRSVVGSACYKFFEDEMFANGVAVLDIGRARAFLRDGLFQYKRRWRYSISVDPFFPRKVSCRIRNNPQGRAFLRDNPLILETDGGLIAVVLLDNPAPADRSEVENVLRTYFADGLEKMIIYSTSGFTALAHSTKNPNLRLIHCEGDLLIPVPELMMTKRPRQSN